MGKRKGYSQLAARHLWHTAVHEAGHAVIGRVLVVPHGEATIIPDYEQGFAGLSKLAVTSYEEIRDHWFDTLDKHREESVAAHARIISFMAGAEAERVVIGHSLEADGHDRRQIKFSGSDLMDTCSEEWTRWHARLRRQTARLCGKHRATIERVAIALIERDTLQAHEIDQLMAGPKAPSAVGGAASANG